MKNAVFSLIIAASFFAISPAFAEREKGGNGGDAYGETWTDSKGKSRVTYYSLDLVEWGIERDNFKEQDLTADQDVLNLVSQKIRTEQSFPREMFAKKMTALKSSYPLYYQIALQVFTNYNWRFINAELEDINDATSNVKLDSNRMKQAAIRYGDLIQISNYVWNRMNELNQLALVYHEINFAIQKLESYVPRPYYQQSYAPCDWVQGLGTTLNNVIHNSDLARKLTAALFDPTIGLVEAMVKGIQNVPATKEQQFREAVHKKDNTVRITFAVTPTTRIVKRKFYEVYPNTFTCPGAELSTDYPLTDEKNYNYSIYFSY